MSTVAQRVIAKCGGPKVVADWLGITPTSVHRMTYSKERGGTGGHIPARHMPVLLNKARQVGVDLSPTDFFEPSSGEKGAA